MIFLYFEIKLHFYLQKSEQMTKTHFSQRETENSKSRKVNLEKKLEKIKKEASLEYNE